jgi:hypothetical protein
MRRVIYKKSSDLIYFAAEAWNQTNFSINFSHNHFSTFGTTRKLTFWHRSFTVNPNKSPTWCNNFSVYYLDVCLQLNMFRTQHDCHHYTKVKPEAATAVIELLMMGGKTPKTCWAANKRQDNKLKNCCIGLGIYLNCTMMHGLTNLKFYILILAHSVCKMWIIQETKKVALWNKRHFEGKKNGECAACLKYSALVFVEKNIYKMRHLYGSGTPVLYIGRTVLKG